MSGEQTSTCEKPRRRSVIIELDGVLRKVPAEYHPNGPLVGRMVTAHAFYAESCVGGCPFPVPMPLHRPTARTDPRLIVIDSLGERWVMGFSIQYQQIFYRITSFHSAAGAYPYPAPRSG